MMVLLVGLVGPVELVQLVGLVEPEAKGGMVPTTASFTKLRGGVTHAAIWKKPQVSPPSTLTENLQSTGIMYISLHHKRQSTNGFCMSVKIWHAHFSMLEALLMYVQGGEYKESMP